MTEDIVTDEVIITDERIAHIQERHPNDYERYYKYLKEIVEHPQYIVETNKPYTALILNEFIEGEEIFKTVMRLTTSHDNPEFKNSIITFMKINDKEWKRILKNKRILYKSE
ncbi:MAG: PBECR2 nuclease fold domain-containing protein [Lachnospiraceae bacterium]|nr:PBECR2 nuclease fold domain-containing protein [Lachnospiraceae bacterium]